MAPILETAVRIFVYALEGYAACGVLFAVPFVIVGVRQIDEAASGTGIGFRLPILPRVAAFWTINQHGNRLVVRMEKNGQFTVLADRYDGKRLNSPNDLVYESDGALYFTDPSNRAAEVL